jgi:hypothetical protein
MDDPIAKMLLPDAEFARLSADEKFAYIQNVLRALLAEHAAGQKCGGGDNPS